MTGPPRNAHVAWSQPEDHLPRPADQVAAVDHDARTHRRVGRRDPHGRVVAPDLVLRLLVEQGQVPVVHADDRADPAGGTAGAGDAPHRFVEERRIALQAAPLLGLEQLEEADLVEFGDGLVRESAAVPRPPARAWRSAATDRRCRLGPTARHAVQWTSLDCLRASWGRYRTRQRLEHVTICVEQRIPVAAGPADMHFCNLF